MAKLNKTEKTIETAVAVIDAPQTQELEVAVPLNADFFEEFAGDGNENVGLDDIQVQFLSIIESNSKVLKRSDGKYIAGAQAQNVFNNITREVFNGEKGIVVIPCHYKKEVVLWNDSMIVGRFSAEGPEYAAVKAANLRNAGNKLVDAEGNEWTETAYHGVLLVNQTNGSTTRVMISMTGTKLKKSKQLNTLIEEHKETTSKGKVINPPRYAQIYLLKVVPEKNKKGDYFNWDPSFIGLNTSREGFMEAKAYHDELKANTIVVTPPSDLAPSNTEDAPF